MICKFKIYSMYKVCKTYKISNKYVFIYFADLHQAEYFLSGLKQVIEKQNDEISQFRNEIGKMKMENKRML